MDRTRLEWLLQAHGNTLYRAALAVLKDCHEAEDAVQDTLLTYLEKAPAFESEAHEKAWLLRVTLNYCKSRLRSPWRRRTVPLTDTLPAIDGEREELTAILSLPPKERMTIHLYYYEGYQTEEIAALTGARPGTVRSRLARARAHLRDLLKGEVEC